MKDGVTVEVDPSSLIKAAEKLARAMDRDFGEVLEEGFGVALEDIARRPFVAKISKGMQNKAIDKDLNAIFEPVRLKGKRPEETPDLSVVHKRLKRRAHGRRIKRDRPQAYYVDAGKLRALRRKLKDHIGLTAANWLPALRRLGRGKRIPGYVTRHTGIGGGFSKDTAGRRKSITAVNQTPPGADHMASKMEAAVRFGLLRQIGRMERRAKYIIRLNARKAGFDSPASSAPAFKL